MPHGHVMICCSGVSPVPLQYPQDVILLFVTLNRWPVPLHRLQGLTMRCCPTGGRVLLMFLMLVYPASGRACFVHQIELRLAVRSPFNAHFPINHHVHEHVIHTGEFGPAEQRRKLVLGMGAHGASRDDDFLAFIVAQKRRRTRRWTTTPGILLFRGGLSLRRCWFGRHGLEVLFSGARHLIVRPRIGNRQPFGCGQFVN